MQYLPQWQKMIAESSVKCNDHGTFTIRSEVRSHESVLRCCGQAGDVDSCRVCESSPESYDGLSGLAYLHFKHH